MTVLDASAAPPVKLPGRKPGSQEPWGAFLGRSAHLAIGLQYGVQYPTRTVFLDTELFTLVEDGELGDPERLSEFVRRLRPDITDMSARVLFEIKPDTAEALEEGRQQAGNYLEALNKAVDPDKKLSGGTGYTGSLFLEFEGGGALWELSWRTPEPGVTLYRWSYRRGKEGSRWQERADQPREEIPLQELERRGELVEQVLRAAYAKRALPEDFDGQVFLPVNCH